MNYAVERKAHLCGIRFRPDPGWAVPVRSLPFRGIPSTGRRGGPAPSVKAVRQAGGWYSVNIAHPNRAEIARVGPVEMAEPFSEPDRRTLVEAVAEAEEIASAVPSVQNYTSPHPGSLDRLLADGLRNKSRPPLARCDCLCRGES